MLVVLRRASLRILERRVVCELVGCSGDPVYDTDRLRYLVDRAMEGIKNDPRRKTDRRRND